MKWIDMCEEHPANIGQRVLVYPFDDEIEVGEYIGEGWWRIGNYAVHGTEFTHWALLPNAPTQERR